MGWSSIHLYLPFLVFGSFRPTESFTTITEEPEPSTLLLKKIIRSVVNATEDFDVFIFITMSSDQADYCDVGYKPCMCFTTLDQPVKIEHLFKPLYLIINPESDEKVLKIVKILRKFQKSAAILIVHQTPHVTIQKFKTYDIYHIFFLVPVHTEESYLIYEICQFCNKGKNKINIINKWTVPGMFESKLVFPPSFKGEFFGAHLKIACKVGIPPFFFVVGVAKDGKKLYGGYEHTLLEMARQRLNFHYEIVEPEDDEIGDVIDGEPTGLLKILYEKRADVGMCSIGAHHFRRQFADFSLPIASDYTVIVSTKPKRSIVWYALLNPFSIVIWLLLLLLILGSAITVYYVNSDVSKNRKEFTQYLFNFLSIVIRNSNMLEDMNAKCYLVLMFFMVAITFLINLYTAFMTSAMTSPLFVRPPIDTPDQIIQYDMEWLAVKGRGESRVFDHNPEVLKRRKWVNRLEDLADLTVKYYNDYVYVLPEKWDNTRNLLANGIDKFGETRLHYSSEKLVAAYLIWMYPSDVNYKNAIDHILRLVDENGIGSFLKNNIYFNHLLKARKEAILANRVWDITGNEYVNLKHLKGIVAICLSIMGLSTVVFLFQLKWKQICKKLQSPEFIQILRGRRRFLTKLYRDFFRNVSKCSPVKGEDVIRNGENKPRPFRVNGRI